MYNGSLGESVQTGGGGGEEGADKKLSVVFIWESRSCGSGVGPSGKRGGRGKARIATMIHVELLKGKRYNNNRFVNAHKNALAGKKKLLKSYNKWEQKNLKTLFSHQLRWAQLRYISAK